jgi:hypothetical protein
MATSICSRLLAAKNPENDQFGVDLKYKIQATIHTEQGTDTDNGAPSSQEWSSPVVAKGGHKASRERNAQELSLPHQSKRSPVKFQLFLLLVH